MMTKAAVGLVPFSLLFTNVLQLNLSQIRNLVHSDCDCVRVRVQIVRVTPVMVSGIGDRAIGEWLPHKVMCKNFPTVQKKSVAHTGIDFFPFSLTFQTAFLLSNSPTLSIYMTL